MCCSTCSNAVESLGYALNKRTAPKIEVTVKLISISLHRACHDKHWNMHWLEAMCPNDLLKRALTQDNAPLWVFLPVIFFLCWLWLKLCTDDGHCFWDWCDCRIYNYLITLLQLYILRVCIEWRQVTFGCCTACSWVVLKHYFCGNWITIIVNMCNLRL